jgi:hypothetical protein
MYTGGKLFRIFPGHENQITRRVPSQQPGPDQPVGAIKPKNLTDDNLKVTNSLFNSSLGSQVNHQGS